MSRGRALIFSHCDSYHTPGVLVELTPGEGSIFFFTLTAAYSSSDPRTACDVSTFIFTLEAV